MCLCPNSPLKKTPVIGLGPPSAGRAHLKAYLHHICTDHISKEPGIRGFQANVNLRACQSPQDRRKCRVGGDKAPEAHGGPPLCWPPGSRRGGGGQGCGRHIVMLWPHTGSTAAFSGANVPPSTTPSVLSQPARDTAAGPPQMRTLRNREADRQAQPRSRGQQVAGPDRLGSSPTDSGRGPRGPRTWPHRVRKHTGGRGQLLSTWGVADGQLKTKPVPGGDKTTCHGSLPLTPCTPGSQGDRETPPVPTGNGLPGLTGTACDARCGRIPRALFAVQPV